MCERENDGGRDSASEGIKRGGGGGGRIVLNGMSTAVSYRNESIKEQNPVATLDKCKERGDVKRISFEGRREQRRWRRGIWIGRGDNKIITVPLTLTITKFRK